MPTNLEIHKNNLADLKRKLAAREGRKEFEKSCEEIRKAIAAKEAVIAHIESTEQ